MHPRLRVMQGSNNGFVLHYSMVEPSPLSPLFRCPGDVRRSERRDEIADRLLKRGVAQLWCKLAERYQNKCALDEPRMRNGELFIEVDEVVVQQNVDVDKARPPTYRGRAPKVVLNLLNIRQELTRWQCGPHLADRVQKGRLVKQAPRRGLLYARAGNNGHRTCELIARRC